MLKTFLLHKLLNYDDVSWYKNVKGNVYLLFALLSAYHKSQK